MWKGRKSISAVLVFCAVLSMGSSCETTDPHVTFTSITGLYTCQETSAHSGLRKYIVEIDRVRDHQNLFIISNFHNQGENEFLYVELDQDSLIIFNQVISNLSVNGKGHVGEDYRSIGLLYDTDDGVTALEYQASYTR